LLQRSRLNFAYSGGAIKPHWMLVSEDASGLNVEGGVAYAMTSAQVWKSSRFTIERRGGRMPGTVIFHLSGPFTARDMHGILSPDVLRGRFKRRRLASQPRSCYGSDGSSLYGFGWAWADDQPLCPVPWQRGSAGCGGSKSRVPELFEMTKVDRFFRGLRRRKRRNPKHGPELLRGLR
jgi:hypothetical protein